MFAVLALVDGFIGHALPVSGRGQSVIGGIVVGLLLNLLVVVLLARPFGALLRRRRTDLPVGVSRDYAGTFAIALVTAGFLAAGLANAANIRADNAALRDALVRAEAYIGDHAPPDFLRNLQYPNTYTIQSGSIYRTCVPNTARTRDYCVVVRRSLPLARSVVPDGSEPNSVLSAGTN